MRRTALLLVTVLIAALGQAVTAPAATAATRTVTLTAVADTMARQSAPTTASGTAASLLSDAEETAGSASRATPYLRFTLPALAAGESISAASLSVLVTNGTTDGPAVYRTASTWAESTLSWNSGQPARSSTTAVGSFAGMGTGRVATAVSGITGSGDVSFQLHADATDGLAFASRENATAANRPQLVLTVTSGATAPAAPTSVTASSTSAGTATLQWAPPTTDGGSPITGYRVARDGTDTSGAGPWSGTVAATARSFTFSRLAAGTPYRLSVSAINAVGTGPAGSASITLTPTTTRSLVLTAVADTMARQQAPTTASGALTSLASDTEETSGTTSRITPYLRFTVPALAPGESISAASLSLQVTNATANGPAVWRTSPTWSESALSWNSGQPARSGTAAVGNFGSMAAGRVSTPVSGVTGAGDVSFQLYAEVSDGMVFASRETTTAGSRPQLVLTVASSTVTAPGAPTSVSGANVSPATGTLTWAPPAGDGGSAITGYRVARDGTDSAGAGPWSGTVSATTRSFTFTKLVPDRTYTLTVSAINAAGTSPAVARSVYVVPDAPVSTETRAANARIAVDPGRTSFVLSFADGRRQRFHMALGDSYVFQLQQGLSREAFAARVAGSHEVVRIDYEPAFDGVSEFGATGVGPYPAPSGSWIEAWNDYGARAYIDESGTSFIAGVTGWDPARYDDAYASMMLRFPLSTSSRYDFSFRDRINGVTTLYSDVGPTEFARLLRAYPQVDGYEMHYDATTRTGTFWLQSSIGVRD